METNNASRAADRPQTGGQGVSEISGAPPPIRPLNRTDSRSSFPPQVPRPAVPPQAQLRPQFQPGGPVTAPTQFAPRPGVPPPRPQVAPGPTGPQQARPPPLRPFGPQSIAPQQGPRPQSPTLAQAPQRTPPPNNLQFGPRQPVGAITPDGARPQIFQQTNGAIKNGAPVQGQLPRQPLPSPLKAPDSSVLFQNKPANLENQFDNKNDQNINKQENGMEAMGMAKGRSFSIAAAPGAPSPLKPEDDRRKSVSAIGGRIGEEFVSRSPGLGLIQEGKQESKENVRGSKESIRSEASNEGRDATDRPESRLSSAKMTESFMGSLSNLTPKKKADDDDDVVLQNTLGLKNANVTPKTQGKTDLSDRSPSLTRSDDSPEPKNTTQGPPAPIKSQTVTPEPQRPKTPKTPEQVARPISAANKTPVKSPLPEVKAPMTPRKPNDFDTSFNTADSKKSTPRKVVSAPKSRPKDGDNDSGVDESTQGNDMNGSPGTPNKKIPTKLPMKEKSSSSLKPNLSRSSSKSATPKTPENPPPSDKKKVPMNKVQVGNAPSPNIKAVKSKIGSLDNATYKPGGGKVKIENRKLEFGNITPKIAAKNDAYAPSGGTKKITTTKLEWNAKSKVGSLQNSTYKPGGGDKKIETVKLDFKEKAKPKVASTANINHKPGGGTVKIENQKLEFKGQSKVGSLDNVKHKPGGGDIKIFDDKDYIKQLAGQSPLPDSQGQSRQEDHYYMSTHEWSEERPKSRCLSARAPRTPRTPRALSPRRKHHAVEEEMVYRNNERNRRVSVARPTSARDPPSSTCSRRASLQRPAFSIY